MIPVEAIERVIDDLETEIEELRITRTVFNQGYLSYFMRGKETAYMRAVKELQKVLDDYAR